MNALSLAVTLGGFLLGDALARRWRTPLVNPVVVGVACVLLYLAATGIPYARYARDAQPLIVLLGPAVVALALPLHERFGLLVERRGAVLRAVAVACVVGIVGGLLAARGLGLGADLSLALAGRSATAPVAMALARVLGGSGEASGALAILTGMAGATLGPGLLTRLGVRDPVARGLATGCVSHGIGTARIAQEGDAAAAGGALGMVCNAVATAVTLALAWRWLR